MTWAGGLVLALTLVGIARTVTLATRSVRGALYALTRGIPARIRARRKRAAKARAEARAAHYAAIGRAIVDAMAERARQGARS